MHGRRAKCKQNTACVRASATNNDRAGAYAAPPAGAHCAHRRCVHASACPRKGAPWGCSGGPVELPVPGTPAPNRRGSQVLNVRGTKHSPGPGTSTETLAYFIFNVGFEWYDMGYASALAWILTAIMMAISVWYVRMLLSERKMATA